MNSDIIINEKIKVTNGLVKIVPTVYAIPNQLFCPECKSILELKTFDNTGRYDCVRCRYSLSAEEYVKQELAKAEQEQK